MHQESNFPTEWKEAVIVMILIPGNDLLTAKDYRSISLLNTMSIIFEKLVLRRLKIWPKDVKYLGVMIDKNLNLNLNTDQIVKKRKRIHVALYVVLNCKQNHQLQNLH